MSKLSRKIPGVTLTELLVVIAIMVILMAVMVPALAAFTHTSRVVSAADTVAVMLRKTRDHALAKNVPTIPVILRDKKGRITMAYAARALTHTADGSLDGGNAPKTWGPAKGVGECSRWSLTRQSLDLPKLEQGAFVYLVGTPTLDLNHPNSGQAYNELVFMKVKRPPTHMLLNDSSKYTYQILMRGVHNTARGNFNLANTGRGTVDGYVVVGSEAGGNDVIQPDGSGVTISGVGVVLPDHITIDQVLNSKNEVCGTITAQAAIFREQSLTLAWGGKYEPPQFYPLFTPIFMPDGRVSAGFHNGASGAEVNRSFASRYVGQTLRVLDTITREARYIHVRAGGQVVVRTTLPGRYGDSETALAPGKGGVPVTDYKTVYPEPPPPPPPVVTPPPKPPIVIPPPPTTTSSSGSPGNPPPAKPPVTQPPTPPPPTPPTPPPPPSPTSTSSSGGRTSTSTSSNGGGGELDDGNWNWPWSR